MREAKTFITVILLLVIFDIIFFGIIASEFYNAELGDSMLESKRFWSAGIVYILLATGITVFVIPNKNNIAFYGGLFGLIVYGVYDFTNYTFLKSWTLPVVYLDVAWGTIASSLVSILTKQILKKSNKS